MTVLIYSLAVLHNVRIGCQLTYRPHQLRSVHMLSVLIGRVMESTVFKCGRGQGVYLPEAVALPDEVTQVDIVVVGRTRIITPLGESWDSWFDEPGMSADFMAEREPSAAQHREKL